MRLRDKFALTLGLMATVLFAVLWPSQSPVQAQLAASTGFHYANITTSGSTVVKAAQGTLHTLTVNNAGTSWTYQIFDNTACSGTVVACSTACAVPASGVSLHYDIQTNTGICVKTATGTPGDLTIAWR